MMEEELKQFNTAMKEEKKMHTMIPSVNHSRESNLSN